MVTFLQLKNLIRLRVFPAGEARNLRIAHDKSIVDALIDLQRWVQCLQNKNYFLAPHCATFFNCGLTSFDFPRGIIKKLSVVSNVKSGSTASGSSGNGSSNGGSTVSPGTVVATVNDSIAIFAAPKSLQTLYAVVSDQTFEVAVTMAGQNCGGPAKSQNVRTTIDYTDVNGDAKTIQVGQECHLNECNVQGIATIAVKGGTTIHYTLTPTNVPFTDGGVNVGITVTAASSNSAVSSSGSTTSATSTTAATQGGEWCDEIVYDQVEPCDIQGYLSESRRCGFCYDISAFFAIPSALCGNKTTIPTPTDVGLDPKLPPLPLGYHYPQESTDSKYGRAKAGVWAIEGGRVYVAPWIQSTETVVAKWQGIKRDWQDTDVVDDDPGLFRAIEAYLRWEHARDWDSDLNKTQIYEIEYRKALADLIYDCAEENRVRSCEPSLARATAPADADRFTPDEPQTPPVIPPVIIPTEFWNDIDAVATITCASLQEASAPEPTGAGVTVTVKAHTVHSTSVEAANLLAQQTADALAQAQIAGKCTFYNRAVTRTAHCPNNDGPDVDATVLEGLHSSTDSQALADSIAAAQAQLDANALLQCGGVDAHLYWNAYYDNSAVIQCTSGHVACQYVLTFFMPAHKISSTIPGDADAQCRARVDLKVQQAKAKGCTNPTWCGKILPNIEVTPIGNIK